MSRGAGLAAVGLAALLWAGPARAADDPWLGRDKVLHFSTCTLIAGGGYGLAALSWEQPWARALFGGGLAVGIGAAKEGVDALGFGDPSWRDFTWDAAGAATGAGIAWAIDWAVSLARGEEQRALFRDGTRLRF